MCVCISGGIASVSLVASSLRTVTRFSNVAFTISSCPKFLYKFGSFARRSFSDLMGAVKTSCCTILPCKAMPNSSSALGFQKNDADPAQQNREIGHCWEGGCVGAFACTTLQLVSMWAHFGRVQDLLVTLSPLSPSHVFLTISQYL